MKRSTLILTALAVMFYLGGTIVFAQGGVRGGHAGGSGMGHGDPGTSHGNPNIKGGSGGKSTEMSSTQQLNKVVASSASATPSKLASKLNSLATSMGFTNFSAAVTAAGGSYKNLGQAVAALHVFKNLDIAKSTACSGMSAMDCWTKFTTAQLQKGGSLGKAIKSFDPNANTSAELKKGKKEASEDMKESGS